MKFEITRQIMIRSEKVKGMDFHPTEPWILTTQYNGKLEIWSYVTNSIVKSIYVTEMPIRSGKFIARKNWVIVGSDDYYIRVYNYNTGEKVTQFEAHPDYIRSISVHPTKPYILTGSDDQKIKLWNWEQKWKCERTYEGHQHYVMCVCFNPKDPNMFASASLDRTVKVWSINCEEPNFTLLSHEKKGVNYIDYYPHFDKPYLVTCSDEQSIKIWDYQTKSCVSVLEGHSFNVSFAVFHHELPIIISGSEDGSVKIWNSNSFKLEESINFELERSWCISLLPKSNLVCIGFDLGFVVVKIGNEEPLFSMDSNNKLVFSKNLDIFQTMIKSSTNDTLIDGEILPFQHKELGSVEMYMLSLSHSPNSKYIAVCGDGEYVIYTSLSWRSKAYGNALDFVWNNSDYSNSCMFAIRESPRSIKIFKNFQEHLSIDLTKSSKKLFAGNLLGVKMDNFILFYEWNYGNLIRKIDLDEEVQNVIWSENGDLLAIIANNVKMELKNDYNVSRNFEVYFLKYNLNVDVDEIQTQRFGEEIGESSFEILNTLTTSEGITSGIFIGGVFIYTTSKTNRLNYFVGGEVINLAHFNHKYYIAGYRLNQNERLYLIDKSHNIISWFVNSKLLEVQTLVMNDDLHRFAKKIINETSGEEEPDIMGLTLDDLSDEYRTWILSFNKTEANQLSRFFNKLGYLSLSYALSQDFETKFQISLTLNNLKNAHDLLLIAKNDNENNALVNKWKNLGDLALNKWNFKLARECFWNSNDYSSLLLLFTSTNDVKDLTELAEKSELSKDYNISFQAWWFLGNKEKCLDLLNKNEKYLDSSLFCLTHFDKKNLPFVIDQWKKKLNQIKKNNISERLIQDLDNLNLTNTQINKVTS